MGCQQICLIEFWHKEQQRQHRERAKPRDEEMQRAMNAIVITTI
jgi:hypothetical protein